MRRRSTAPCGRGADEVLVADGGSRGTPRGNAPRRREPACCKRHAGAGRNSNAGAAAARGDVLWFVHADTRLSPRGGAAIRRALEDPRVAGGNFRIQFDPGPHDRFMTAFYYVIRHLRLFYGDSAIFCRRTAFEAAGGFPPHPVMEDLALVHRLYREGRMVYLPEPVRASPRRWEQAGVRKPHMAQACTQSQAGPVASTSPAVGILTRASQAGRSRTRLAKALEPAGAAAELLGNGYTPVVLVLVGSDIPTLKRERVAEALTALRRADDVFGHGSRTAGTISLPCGVQATPSSPTRFRGVLRTCWPRRSGRRGRGMVTHRLAVEATWTRSRIFTPCEPVSAGAPGSRTHAPH